jgi:hypothetical protein
VSAASDSKYEKLVIFRIVYNVLVHATALFDAHQKLTQFPLLQCSINNRQKARPKHATGMKNQSEENLAKSRSNARK